MQAVKRGRDHLLRMRLFTERSFEHKARLNLNWLSHLITKYIPDSALVLDPMGGVGSTLFATWMGKPTIVGELEEHWCRVAADNLTSVQAQRDLFTAPGLVCRWDARRLPIATGSIPAVLFSPPYADLFSDWNRNSGHALDGKHVGETGQCYGFDPRQVGNIHIYENYLRAMTEIYSEVYRVLRPGGELVLVVGDRVHKRRRVPVVDDALTLVRSMGFLSVARDERQAIPSRFRLIHQHRLGDDYPMVDTETALVLRKPEKPGRPAAKWFLIEAPGDNGPGRQLYSKQVQYAYNHLGTRDRNRVLVWSVSGLDLAGCGGEGALAPERGKARERRERAFGIVAELVERGLRAGDRVEIHTTLEFARYIRRRLETLGVGATIPTQAFNLGQKLTWYTEAIREHGKTSDDRKESPAPGRAGDQPQAPGAGL